MEGLLFDPEDRQFIPPKQMNFCQTWHHCCENLKSSNLITGYCVSMPKIPQKFTSVFVRSITHYLKSGTVISNFGTQPHVQQTLG
jgi:hypothetical protein